MKHTTNILFALEKVVFEKALNLDSVVIMTLTATIECQNKMIVWSFIHIHETKEHSIRFCNESK